MFLIECSFLYISHLFSSTASSREIWLKRLKAEVKRKLSFYSIYPSLRCIQALIAFRHSCWLDLFFTRALAVCDTFTQRHPAAVNCFTAERFVLFSLFFPIFLAQNHLAGCVSLSCLLSVLCMHSDLEH